MAVPSTQITLLKTWMGCPPGMKHNLMKVKADQLIKAGIAEPTGKPKKTTGAKHRMMESPTHEQPLSE